MAKFKVVLRKDGTQTVEALDAVGDSCIALTQDYEKRSGLIVDRKLKPEYHEIETIVVTESVIESAR